MEHTDTSQLPVITPAELAMRDGKTMPQVWIAWNGLVYDMTESKLFKNGKHFRHATGMDLTAEMPNAPHTDRVFNEFKPIGKLG